MKHAPMGHSVQKSGFMIRAAIAFFLLAIVAYALGAGGVAGLSVEIGKVLVMVFLVLAILSFAGALFSGRRSRIP